MYYINQLINKMVLLCGLSLLFSCRSEPILDIEESVGMDQSIYIQMPDDVRLAIDISLPQKVNVGKRVPTLLRTTRYWRSEETVPAQTNKNPIVDAILDRGYAVVAVDARGTGASFGSRENEFSLAEAKDLAHVVDWVAVQSWSNGSVGTIGYSYDGNTAENAIFDASPALKAAVPLFTDFDIYSSIIVPGGLRNNTIIKEWGEFTAALDRNNLPEEHENYRVVGVKPVDEDVDKALLAQAVAEHKNNLNVTEVFSDVTFRDDVIFAQDLSGPVKGIVSPHLFQNVASKKSVPAFHWGSWMDASTAAGVLARFAGGDAPAQYVIGPWNHGASDDANPYLPADAVVNPSTVEQFVSIFNFLDSFMYGSSRGLERELFYFTMGENLWKRTKVWPPKGSSKQRYYFNAGNRLGEIMPDTSSGATRYRVDFDHGTGSTSRWSTQLHGGEVNYGDRREVAERLLNFTTEPFEDDVEITGHPVIHLEMSSTTTDGAVIAYLQDVAPNGTVRMLTEGHLRLVHRKMSDEKSPYPIFNPYHTFLRKDGADMIPGKTAAVSFALLPTSVVIKKGHALRIAIAGHDKDVFARVPTQGVPVYQIEHNAKAVSYLEAPVVSRGQQEGTDQFLDLFK